MISLTKNLSLMTMKSMNSISQAKNLSVLCAQNTLNTLQTTPSKGLLSRNFSNVNLPDAMTQKRDTVLAKHLLLTVTEQARINTINDSLLRKNLSLPLPLHIDFTLKQFSSENAKKSALRNIAEDLMKQADQCKNSSLAISKNDTVRNLLSHDSSADLDDLRAKCAFKYLERKEMLPRIDSYPLFTEKSSEQKNQMFSELAHLYFKQGNNNEAIIAINAISDNDMKNNLALDLANKSLEKEHLESSRDYINLTK